MCGRLRGVWARARWRVWVLGNSTIILRKAVRRENFAKDVKFSDCRKSIRKQIRPSCRKIFRPYFVFQVFGFLKATKFIDSSEFSVCVQNVLSKSCLPCRCWYWTKKNCRARKGEGRKERDVFNTGHSKLPFASNLNRVFVGNVYLENEFDLHENYVIKCEDTYSTSICVNAFSFPYVPPRPPLYSKTIWRIFAYACAFPFPQRVSTWHKHKNKMSKMLFYMLVWWTI